MALLELTVTDLALIERLRVPLRDGLTVITGETGAGKSLLIDALTLVLGGRSDAGLVRSGAQTARVEALFDQPGEPLICVRELSVSGRTIARIDDATVTIARLAAIVEPLVEIHGQHDQGRLLSEAAQRDLLDAAGGHATLRVAVADAVDALRANEAAMRELEVAPEELERRSALAQHGADEIAAADVRPGEVAELQARRTAAASMHRIARLTGSAIERLDADGTGVRDALSLVARELGDAAALDPSLTVIAERAQGAAAEVDDLAHDLRRAIDGGELGPADLAAIDERLGTLFGLLRKYGPSEEDVLAQAAALAAEVDRLADLEAERQRRQAAAGPLMRAAEDAAAALHAARVGAALRLTEGVTAALRELGFPDAAFRADVHPAVLDATGSDAVAFLLAPNLGEPARPLARIASGGELSRVALAIKSVLAAADATPTLVFDEVDAGIGGRSADPVGMHLWRLSRSHQVLCVTHLPQIAAHADVHLRIAKRTHDGRTVTEIREVVAHERLTELAEMLGGAAAAGGADAAARELLERAHAAHAAAVPAR